MPTDSSASEFWFLDGSVGRARAGSRSAQVDLARPQLGLHRLRLCDESLVGQLLAIAPGDARAWPGGLADAYGRGGDLVARYEPSGDWPFAPQVYWRAESFDNVNGPRGGLSLLVSIQTDFLHPHPRLDVQTELPAEQLVRVMCECDEARVEPAVVGRQDCSSAARACCLIWRLPGGRHSYAEIMPASDFRQLAVESPAQGVYRSRWRLFGEFLEKGVIWRARLQALLLPREDDTTLAAECCRATDSRPLPL